VHARTVTSSRGSSFLLCRLSAADPWFSRYPVLPVRVCPGYTEGGGDAGPAGDP
jgi:hypothetical protein